VDTNPSYLISTDPTPLLSVDFPCGPLSLPLFLYSWVFLTGGSVCCHLLTLVPRSRIFFTLKMEAIRSSETSVHTRSTWRHIPEDGILHSHHCEILKSYNLSDTLYGNYMFFYLMKEQRFQAYKNKCIFGFKRN
jgi:hypothetical protein